jgi:serine/threonine protein kinase
LNARLPTITNFIEQEFIPTNNSFNKQLLDLLRKIFVYDPKQRITAKQALKHPWFKETMVDDGTEALRIRDQREEDARLAELRARADAQHQADLQHGEERQAKRMREA